MIKFPEAVLISGTALTIFDNAILGYSLIGLSFFIAFSRFGLELSQQKEAKESSQKMTQIITDGLSTFVGKSFIGSKNNGNVH